MGKFEDQAMKRVTTKEESLKTRQLWKLLLNEKTEDQAINWVTTTWEDLKIRQSKGLLLLNGKAWGPDNQEGNC